MLPPLAIQTDDKVEVFMCLLEVHYLLQEDVFIISSLTFGILRCSLWQRMGLLERMFSSWSSLEKSELRMVFWDLKCILSIKIQNLISQIL